jgi:hypothetical protein
MASAVVLVLLAAGLWTVVLTSLIGSRRTAPEYGKLWAWVLRMQPLRCNHCKHTFCWPATYDDQELRWRPHSEARVWCSQDCRDRTLAGRR